MLSLFLSLSLSLSFSLSLSLSLSLSFSHSLSLSLSLSLSISLSLAIITTYPYPRFPSSFFYHVFVTFLSLSITMSGNLPFSHETVVHSLMREAVAWSQTIRNRICFSMVKINHTAWYWRMAKEAQTNSSIPLNIWDHPLQCQHFVRYVSVEQYFSAAVLLSVSESWSPLTWPLPQKALVVSLPVWAWTPNRASER